MIHRCRISNFQSIREEVQLDFRIPRTCPDLPRFRQAHSGNGVRLPSVIAFIGPNGSGKTTLLRAITESIEFAHRSFDLGGSQNIPYFLPFLSSDAQAAPTRIELEFDAAWFSANTGEQSLCRYTLELERKGSDLNPVRVFAETLHTFPNGRPRRMMERRGDGPVYVAGGLGIRRGDDRLSSVPANASVVSTLARLGLAPFPLIAQDLENVQRNLIGSSPWRPDTETVTRFYRERPALLDKLSDRLQRFDLGIKTLRIATFPDGQPILLCDHHGLDVPVVIAQESTGTRHLVHVFPQLDFALQTGQVAIMDALDSEFHTELVAEVLRWFQRPETNPHGAQLICSLHNQSVLEELEKEELFIVEKGQDGATRAYGAKQVHGLRRTEDLHKRYRSGVLGGLPTFG